jgi:hypothetical protein
MSTHAKCKWCGRTFEKSGWNQFASHNTFGLAGKEAYCSKRCQMEAEANAGGGGDNSSSGGGQSSGGGFFGSIINADATKKAAEMSMTPEQIRAKAEVDAQRRKEVDDSNQQFIDSTKKLFGSTLSKIMPGKFTDKAKEARDHHKKMQDLEVDIKIALAKNNNEQALELIRLLRHGSTYLVDGTTTSYSDYWEQKRQDYLNKI